MVNPLIGTFIHRAGTCAFLERPTPATAGKSFVYYEHVVASVMTREFFTPEPRRWIAPSIHLASDSMLRFLSSHFRPRMTRITPKDYSSRFRVNSRLPRRSCSEGGCFAGSNSIKVRFGEAAETKSPQRLLPRIISQRQPVSGTAGLCAVVQTLDRAAARQE